MLPTRKVSTTGFEVLESEIENGDDSRGGPWHSAHGVPAREPGSSREAQRSRTKTTSPIPPARIAPPPERDAAATIAEDPQARRSALPRKLGPRILEQRRRLQNDVMMECFGVCQQCNHSTALFLLWAFAAQWLEVSTFAACSRPGAAQHSTVILQR